MGKNCHEMMGHILKYDDSPWDSGEFDISRHGSLGALLLSNGADINAQD
jgi:hypothetical protein